jgi:hypothetical protein
MVLLTEAGAELPSSSPASANGAIIENEVSDINGKGLREFVPSGRENQL